LNGLLLTHLIGVGIWMGCVAVEALLEARRGSSDQQHLDMAALHLKIDLLVEVPALVLVVYTGSAMLAGTPLTLLLVAKLVCAFLAVLFNAVCVWIVIKRSLAAKTGIEAVQAESERLDKLGPLLLPAWLGALAIGAYMWLNAG